MAAPSQNSNPTASAPGACHRRLVRLSATLLDPRATCGLKTYPNGVVCGGVLLVKDWHSYGIREEFRYEIYCQECGECCPNGYGRQDDVMAEGLKYFQANVEAWQPDPGARPRWEDKDSNQGCQSTQSGIGLVHRRRVRPRFLVLDDAIREISRIIRVIDRCPKALSVLVEEQIPCGESICSRSVVN